MDLAARGQCTSEGTLWEQSLLLWLPPRSIRHPLDALNAQHGGKDEHADHDDQRDDDDVSSHQHGESHEDCRGNGPAWL